MEQAPHPQHRRRAEALLVVPPTFAAQGSLRLAVLELRREAEGALARADDRLRAAAEARRAAAERLVACDRALAGTGQVVDPRTGERLQVLRRRPAPRSDPLPTGGDLRPVRGQELRAHAVELLRAAGRPLALADLLRLLAAHGLRPAGRASQTLSNALAVEVRAGRAVRLGRSRYAATPRVHDT